MTSTTTELRTAYEVADENLARLTRALNRPNSNRSVILVKIDQWLDYRLAHGPDDMEVRL